MTGKRTTRARTANSSIASSKSNSTTSRSAAQNSTLSEAAKLARYRKRLFGAKWRSVMSSAAIATASGPMTACVDLDGVLLYHRSEWGTSRLGRVLPLGRKLCRLLRAKGYKITVLTSRPRKQHLLIWTHLLSHAVFVDDVTNLKPPATFYFDDRAVKVPKNWQ